MGRRSRKRRSAGATAPLHGEGHPHGSSRAERDAARRRRSAAAGPGHGSEARRPRRPTAERPAPPWGRFPLTELVILLALVLSVAGLAGGVEGGRGRTMFVAGLVLGSLGGLELAIRDHFAGYRSHTTLLSGAAAAAAMIVVSLLLGVVGPSLSGGVLLIVALAVGTLVFTLLFVRLRRVFQQRSGGLSFR